MKKSRFLLQKIVKLDVLLDKQTPLFLLLVLVLLLRIPNLFEPYWYGDEGIYLTLGQSMNKGALLYTEIIDHKTPLIYYLARVQTQLNFRLLNIAWMLVTTTSFYYFAKKLTDSVPQSTLAGIIFVLLTTLPWLEGHIPNGELFVLGFVLTGFLLISKTPYFEKFLDNKSYTATSASAKNLLFLFAGGILISLGILTKVPAILDFGAILAVGYFATLNQVRLSTIFKLNKTKFRQILATFYQIVPLAIGVLLPIVLSVAYFVLIGSGQDYLDFGLLYNFRYAGSWQLPFENQFLLFSFSLPGKVLYLLFFVLLLTLLKRYLKPALQFTILWFIAALIAATLSNRPYPHYFIQLVPPLALLITLTLSNLRRLIKYSKNKVSSLNSTLLGLITLSLFVATMLLLEFRPYAVTSYYQNWYQLVSGKISKEEYRQRFDWLMNDNYKAAPIINAAGGNDLFIWGTNPMLYALTQKQPTGRFTVAFHIHDFDAYGETMRDVVKKNPPFIVVMKNEKPLPELNNYLLYNYIPDNSQFDNFVLWKRMNHIVE